MIIKPCRNCLKGVPPLCEKRKAVMARIKGVGLTSIAFKCKILDEELAPGTRISAVFRHYEESGYGTREIDEEIKGTIMRKARGGRFWIWLDDPVDGNERYIVKLFPKRLTVLGESRVAVCPECGRPADRENSDNFSICGKCGSGNDSSLWEDRPMAASQECGGSGRPW